MGPRAKQCTGALMTTIHMIKNACGVPVLVAPPPHPPPPGKCPLGPCSKTALALNSDKCKLQINTRTCQGNNSISKDINSHTVFRDATIIIRSATFCFILRILMRSAIVSNSGCFLCYFKRPSVSGCKDLIVSVYILQ